ncbi:MAG TPA: hypothetical protein VFN35_17510 [Ktedonobacteraceae bacterium]|nr:hypothetical protein [Ktedonobacteraceae bacterium]
MPSEENAHDFTDHVELWKDWNETTARMRANTLDNGKEGYRDPLDLYNRWMKPNILLNQWYNATSGVLGWMTRGMMNFEHLLEAQYKFIEVSMQASKEASRSLHEILFPHLQISTRLEIARLEKIIASLEERVYTLEDALVSFENDDSKVGSDQVGEGLAGRLEREEGKSESRSPGASLLQQTGVPGDLAGYLERMEEKLDRLLAALEKLETSAYAEPTGSRDGNEVPGKTQMRRDETQQIKGTDLDIGQE